MKALVNLGALSRNLNRIYQLAGTLNVIAMVKANAYGHGLLPIAHFLVEQGVSCFGVATLQEAETLRAGGIKSKILLMSGAGLISSSERLVELDVTPLVSSVRELEALAGLNKSLKIHLDFDTGMSRGGFSAADVPDLINWLKTKSNNLSIEGISTHLACAESPDCQFSKLQIERFDAIKLLLAKESIVPSMIHIAKSTAIANGFVRAGEWVRPGIALYGGCEGFEPVMSLEAPVTLIKNLKIGDTVGYDQTWTAKRRTRLALIRAGYADGYPRALSNLGFAKIGDQILPIIGRVSMDLVTLDVTDTCVSEGDWVEFSIEEMARGSNTISYEIMTGISERVPRFYVPA